MWCKSWPSVTKCVRNSKFRVFLAKNTLGRWGRVGGHGILCQEYHVPHTLPCPTPQMTSGKSLPRIPPPPAQETGVWRLFAVNPANTVSFKVPPQFTTVWLHLLSFYTCSDSQKRFVIFDVGLQLSVQTVVLYISVDGARRKENGKWVWLCWEGWRKGRTFVELSRCIYFLMLSRPSATKCDFICLPWRINDHPGKNLTLWFGSSQGWLQYNWNYQILWIVWYLMSWS